MRLLKFMGGIQAKTKVPFPRDDKRSFSHHLAHHPVNIHREGSA